MFPPIAGSFAPLPLIHPIHPRVFGSLQKSASKIAKNLCTEDKPSFLVTHSLRVWWNDQDDFISAYGRKEKLQSIVENNFLEPSRISTMNN